MMAALSTIAMAAGALGAIGSAASSYKAGQEQKKANEAAVQAAKEQSSLNDQAMNKANAKKPNYAGIAAANAAAASGGIGSTMLTGAQGVQSSQLSLGKSSMLGG